MFGLLAIFGDLGCSLGPWLAGVISDIASQSAIVGSSSVGLKVGLGAVSLFPALMIMGIFAMRKLPANE